MDRELMLLEQEIEKIHAKAKEFGLDFFPMRFEVCPPEILYTFGAYGMPTRFSHWSFGKSFHRMKTQYDYNLSRIYELVINSDPCYAFLLEGNSLLQNKLVVAHVFAHSDFFKHNACFQGSNRQMVDTMANNAQRIREFEFLYGRKAVEAFLDAAMAVEEHVESHRETKSGSRKYSAQSKNSPQHSGRSNKFPPQANAGYDSPYDDLWALDVYVTGKQNQAEPAIPKKGQKFPPEPEKDLMLFIANHARGLEPWQREILYMLREEMIYFLPQMETKIMNEGWAALWHARIMRELDLDGDETIEFAKMHSGVLQPGRMQLNPYLLGMKIFESIEAKWSQDSPEAGLAKIFEVRELESDISFLRNYLTKELVEELDLYVYKKVGDKWVIVEKDWEVIRDNLVGRLVNHGMPYIVVEDGDYKGNGELYLKHCFEGIELDLKYLEKTLAHVHTLWGRDVHLETVLEERPILFTSNGKDTQRKKLA